MLERYVRNIPSLSAGECALLRQKKIAVIGCGGLGGYVIEFMTRIGTGHIVVVDGDVFEESNLNRQLLSSVALLGTKKAYAAKERILSLCPETEVTVCDVFADEENIHGIIHGCDVVFDCLDGIKARKILADACEKENIPYIYGAISGWVAQAGISLPGDRLVHKLFPEGTVLSDKSVLSFTPAMCASMQVSLGVRLMLGREVTASRVYFSDMLSSETEYIDFK